MAITTLVRRTVRLAATMAAAAMFVIVTPPGAQAEPGVWDIEDFDTCTEMLNDGLDESMQEKIDDTKGCCRHSGGVWNEGQQKCEAPPGEAAGAGRVPEGLVPRGDLQVAPSNPPPPVLVPVQPTLAPSG
ncbi:hypothetical protein FR943_10680 [Mycobacterium sp. TNTM28]|uniref:Uncharacterized protein n=1 Tax=[Mycobacterium] fortunisiensis TaxID=2600579 RepID=A0ABS6KL48_9MYCO|nr:hypothetical protein [[Mycobacterium] fortunisiensis]MBU9764305.1 hypothetical protein [[Mycobacterium] fortunisiensis]